MTILYIIIGIIVFSSILGLVSDWLNSRNGKLTEYSKLVESVHILEKTLEEKETSLSNKTNEIFSLKEDLEIKHSVISKLELKTQHLGKDNINLESQVNELTTFIRDKDENTIQKIKDLESQLSKAELERNEYLKGIKDQHELFNLVNSMNNESIRKITSLYSDFLLLEFNYSSRYLLNKKRPAIKEAKRIKDLAKESKLHIEKYRQMVYKYEYLLQLFPELTKFVDSFDTLSQLEKANSLDDFKENYDRVFNFVSKDEYFSLEEDDRNQRALNNYICGSKSNWQIGRDYELFCGLEYEKMGWDVEYFGMEQKLKDLGRDLIAKKDNEVEIIQCKYWSQRKLIHEKHILQLYGTTIIETVSNPDLFKKVTPVFITNINLSDTAKKFAEILEVRIEIKELKEFPRIKCNIGEDEFGCGTKIYHLPFDQHYDRTRIHKGQGFFANTVKEATSQGFRRSYKYYAK